MHRSFQISSYSGSMDARNWDEKAKDMNLKEGDLLVLKQE